MTDAVRDFLQAALDTVEQATDPNPCTRMAWWARLIGGSNGMASAAIGTGACLQLIDAVRAAVVADERRRAGKTPDGLAPPTQALH